MHILAFFVLGQKYLPIVVNLNGLYSLHDEEEKVGLPSMVLRNRQEIQTLKVEEVVVPFYVSTQGSVVRNKNLKE